MAMVLAALAAKTIAMFPLGDATAPVVALLSAAIKAIAQVGKGTAAPGLG
jgi:hypothetical protein